MQGLCSLILDGCCLDEGSKPRTVNDADKLVLLLDYNVRDSIPAKLQRLVCGKSLLHRLCIGTVGLIRQADLRDRLLRYEKSIYR